MKKKILWGSAGAVAVLLLARVLLGTGREAAGGYRFVEITRGDIESCVSSTGTLQATETVEVGTQVSGQIAEIHVDFNDRVEKGQLIARIDPTLLRQEVRAAEVGVERSRAELEQAKRQYERIAQLYEQKVDDRTASSTPRCTTTTSRARRTRRRSSTSSARGRTWATRRSARRSRASWSSGAWRWARRWPRACPRRAVPHREGLLRRWRSWPPSTRATSA